MNKTIERNWLSCLIYVVIASCIVSLILTYYKFVHRRHLTFFSSRSNARRQQAPNENDVHDPSSQLQSVGLASAVIHSLPAIQFKKEVNKASVDDNMDCAVCLGEFKEEEWLRYLPNCAHLFHVPCIDTWFQSHSTCPLCRADVLYDFNSCNFSVPGSLRREDTCRERTLGHHLLDSVLMGATSSNASEIDSEMTGPKGKGESSTGERNVRALSSLR